MCVENCFNLMSSGFFAMSVVALRCTVLNLVKVGKISYAIDRNIKTELGLRARCLAYVKVFWYSLWFNKKKETQSPGLTTTFKLSDELQNIGNNKIVADNTSFFDSNIQNGDQVLFSMKSIAWGNVSVLFAILSFIFMVIKIVFRAIYG